MRLWLLRWITLVGLLGFVGVVNAQDNVTPIGIPTPHETMLIPLVQTAPQLKGSSVFWSPDSHYIVASNPGFSSTEATFAGTQYGVFDVRSGQFLFSFTGFVDWMPDSQHILMRDEDNTDVQLREVPSGKVVTTLQGTQIGWKWNADRTQAASQSVDNSLHIYDLASGAILQTWRNILVKDALWSDDGRLIAVSGVDTMLRVYDVTTGSLKAQLVGYQPLGWKPDNRQLIVTPSERTFPSKLGVWTLENDRTAVFEVRSLSYAWSPDGSQLAIAGADENVHILDASTGRDAQKIGNLPANFSIFRWHDPHTLILTSGDLAAGISLAFTSYDLQTANLILRAEFDITATSWIQDDQLEIVQNLCPNICRIVFDLKTGQQLSFIEFDGPTLSSFPNLSPDHQWALNYSYPNAPGVSDQDLHLYQVKTGSSVAYLRGYKDLFLYTSWSPDSHYFAVIAENTVRIWAV